MEQQNHQQNQDLENICDRVIDKCLQSNMDLIPKIEDQDDFWDTTRAKGLTLVEKRDQVKKAFFNKCKI